MNTQQQAAEQAALAQKLSAFFAAQAAQSVHPTLRQHYAAKAQSWGGVADDYAVLAVESEIQEIEHVFY